MEENPEKVQVKIQKNHEKFFPNSTDGMLFVLSWPNRPKGQTNNKRKGEKYGNWSYSYHRW